MRKTQREKRAKDVGAQAGRLVLMAIIMTFMVFPFLVCVSNTFKPEGEINSMTPSLIPKQFTFEHVEELFGDPNFLLSIKNSVFLALVTMVLAVIISLPAAYVIARAASKKVGKVAQAWIVLSQMIPVITLTVPLYLILKKFGLTDTMPGIVLVSVIWSVPTTLWLLRGFISGFPVALEEAAKIDGCNIFTMFFRIMLPNILPGVLTAAIFAFIGAWNEFFFALCFMKSPENMTLSMTLYTYIGLAGQSRDGMLAAASLFSTLPGLVLFGFFQRYYVSGMTDGAVK